MTHSKQNTTNKFGLPSAHLETLCHILNQFPEIKEALIFGSRAKGSNHPGSDVDIALKGPELSIKTIAKISHLLNEETTLPYQFDIINFHTITNPNVIDHIRRVGKPLC